MYTDSVVSFSSPVTLGVIGTLLAGLLWSRRSWRKSELPLVCTNEEFAKDSLAVLTTAMSRFQGPFCVPTATGEKVVLPTRYLESIKNDDRFSFAHEMAKVSLTDVIYTADEDRMLTNRSNLFPIYLGLRPLPRLFTTTSSRIPSEQK